MRATGGALAFVTKIVWSMGERIKASNETNTQKVSHLQFLVECLGAKPTVSLVLYHVDAKSCAHVTRSHSNIMNKDLFL